MSRIKFERLFNKNERSVIVAMDHCEFDGPIPGMENLKETASKVSSVVDGILLSPGMLPHCADAFNYKGAPMAVTRLNWSSVYCFGWNYNDAVTVPAFSPKEALKLGADVALISLTLETGSESNDARNIEIFRSICREAKDIGMPVIGEYFPTHAEELPEDEMHKKVFKCARIIAELGADLIKTFYTHDFKAVAASCPVPILTLGAKKCPTQLDALKLAYAQVKDGAAGVVFGRNAVQVPDPTSFQKALCDVVKHEIRPEEAIKKYSIKD